MKPECWKDIPNYEGMYEASTYGRIRSCSRYVFRMGRCGELHTLYRPARMLTLKKRGEYLAVRLYKPDGGISHSVHRLVAQTFLGGVGDEVNHKDQNKHNNNLANLEWCDRSYNQTYSRGPNLVATNGKEVHHIKGVRATAELIGVSLCSVQRMMRGEYKSVKGWEVRHKGLD